MNRGKVCVEVALNGAWTRRVQPRMPITPDEIMAEAVACAEAGASVVHFHAYDAAAASRPPRSTCWRASSKASARAPT